ncbi:lytic polysaccharide monooxygenase [Microbulbifer sp. CAU 1566]|uniref:lytic polysaccharide monooxygenase n=1 Tax=Microbulbifer sp. CAU 1566 TaxID=2933269 RepID=UPI00200485BF|nr:lytic polysaccharide monooxygenase [Microbulbifer sp. CAU 1566]MCK7598862.1 lytic polysaccharide monooxygenase [Microbulbifer sp. CAU 1566]
MRQTISPLDRESRQHLGRSALAGVAASTSLPLLLLATTLSLSSNSFAHGTMEVPESRIYNCFLNNPENPSDPACAAAKATSGSQQFYDWNEINQASADGNHRALVPDGQLCSAGRSKYAGMDLARSDWQATPITPKADGTFDFRFYATAPHSTREWVFYITRQGYTGSEPLKWSDLFEFCRLGNEPVGADKRYTLTCPLPQVTGKHVIYTTWQRNDSTEAFYTCTDVVLGDGGSSPWADQGPLDAQNDLVANSVVTLRLFNSAGNDLETLSYTLSEDATGADWGYAFSQMVNSQSQYARIGVLDPSSGDITAVSGGNNRIYTPTEMSLAVEVDIETPQGNLPPQAVITLTPDNLSGAGSVSLSATQSSDPDSDPLSYSWTSSAGSLGSSTAVETALQLDAPATARTVTVKLTVSDGSLTSTATAVVSQQPASTGGGDYDYVYPQGLGNYVPGETVVQGSDGNRYQCRPFPQGQWCNINSAYHYAPGSGTNWGDAWIAL